MTSSEIFGFLNIAAINFPEPSGSSPPLNPPGNIIICEVLISSTIAEILSSTAAGVKFLITKISGLPPAFLQTFALSYSQFVPGNTGIKIFGFAILFLDFFKKSALYKLLEIRDGLILGICNGFQALIKLGLLPYGKICELEKDSPTLTHNNLGRHVSQMVRTRITSNISPWLANNSVGDIHTIAISHGEGRFVASDNWLKKLSDNGQIATQYVDFENNPASELPFNPNGSDWAIEGITDITGKIFGKMGHSERIGENVCKNISGDKNQKLFEAGVNYFS